MTTTTALKKILKGILHRKQEDKHSHDKTGWNKFH
jgi:hypothetical protein